MMIRRTVKLFNRKVNIGRDDEHSQSIIRKTYWVLFVPVYSSDYIFKHDLY